MHFFFFFFSLRLKYLTGLQVSKEHETCIRCVLPRLSSAGRLLRKLVPPQPRHTGPLSSEAGSFGLRRPVGPGPSPWNSALPQFSPRRWKAHLEPRLLKACVSFPPDLVCTRRSAFSASHTQSLLHSTQRSVMGLQLLGGTISQDDKLMTKRRTSLLFS